MQTHKHYYISKLLLNYYFWVLTIFLKKKKNSSGNSFVEQGWHPVAKVFHLRSCFLTDFPFAYLLGDNELPGHPFLKPELKFQM
jgi:hypothetical protein